ncbi:hypothetical protein [Turicibacter sanguinis]|uniref:hypothetical protein n=1 Tax=Turicibacter sanguinis TaxID=154288 RepID=UPI001897EF5F|nr:hypothetical protein [Turicibacter sanguinis]
MDLLKVFKILGDTDITIMVDRCFVKNLTINNIKYMETQKEYFIPLEDTFIIISENLEFQKVDDSYIAELEEGGIIVVRNDMILNTNIENETDRNFDEDDFLDNE